MTSINPPHWFTDDEKSIRVVPPATYDPEIYRADAHQAGMAQSLGLLVQGRPGAALKRASQTVTDEMACLGYPGIVVPITAGMARVIHAKRVREARRAVAS